MDTAFEHNLEEGEVLYIVNFLHRDIMDGINSGVIYQNRPEGYYLADVIIHGPVAEDFVDFSEKFGISADDAWMIFTKNSHKRTIN